MSEVQRAGGGASALAVRRDQQDWTQGQAQALFDMFGIGDAPPAVIQGYFHVCQTTGLDPFKRQIHLIERKGKWTPQTSIDGFRIIRDRSQQYDGDETFWCGEDGEWRDAWLLDAPPVACKFVLYLKNRSRPVTAIARWSEYVQTTREGNVTQMWNRMKAHMLAKVAEALAIRKAFPDDTGGLYTDDEMAQAHLESAPSGGRDRSPGIMDLEPPPVAAAPEQRGDPGVGGGFMDAPPAEEDPNVEDAVVVAEPETRPEEPAAAPAAVEEPAPVSEEAPAAPTPETADSGAEGGAPMDMAPEATPEPDHAYLWSAELVKVLEAESFSIYMLREFYDRAAEHGALGEPVPWAGRTVEDTVQAIRANLESGRDALADVMPQAGA